MIPHKLTLRGFIGIRDGLGREELVLDLDRLLADDARLVAIIGENGIGKTTVLDNFQPYRLLPFRAGGYSPGSFSFYDNVLAPEASKELIWEHAGVTYRSTLLFRQTPKTRKTEAYLAVQTADGGWAPYTAPDGTPSDGKTDAYDRCLDAVLGSPELFFTAAFSAQRRKLLAEYGNGEIKPLMSELLGLGAVLEHGRQASEVARALKAQLAGLALELRRANEAAEQCDEAKARGARIETEQATAAVFRQAARDAVHAATRALADLQAQANDQAQLMAQRRELEAELSRMEQTAAARAREIEHDMAAVREQQVQAAAKHEKDCAWAQSQRTMLKQDAERQQQLLLREREIGDAPAQIEALRAVEAALDGELPAAHERVNELRRIQTEAATCRERMQSLVAAGKRAAQEVESLRLRAKLASEVPCAGTDLQPRCKLLAEAVTAHERLPEAEVALEQSRADYQTLYSESETLAAAVHELQAAPARVQELEDGLRHHRQQIAHLQEAAALAEQLQHARATLERAQAQLAELAQRENAALAEYEQARAALDERQTALSERQTALHDETQHAVLAVRARLTSLPTPLSADPQAAAQQRVEAADTELAAAEREHERLGAELAAARERQTAAERQIARSAQTVRQAETLDREIALWITLARGLSNDGVIALCIDDAGPTLAALANDLLAECFGARFAVRIDTQRETAAGTLREGFEIMVFDSERGDEKPLRMTSGGERIWLNEAITRAIALYQAQSSGRHYECLFADESDGALDPEHKQQFLRMKRRVLELGGYRREFFISHTPELWSLADAVLDLTQFRVAA